MMTAGVLVLREETQGKEEIKRLQKEMSEFSAPGETGARTISVETEYVYLTRCHIQKRARIEAIVVYRITRGGRREKY
jgi:hypothetical protein